MTDLQKDPDDLFADECHLNTIKFCCTNSGLSTPQFWLIKPSDRYMGYAISICLSGGNKGNYYDANVVFVTNDLSASKNRMVELSLLRFIKQELGCPTLLTVKANDSGSNDQVLKAAGFEKTSIRWHDKNDHEYDVFTYHCENVGSFDHLMEKVKSLGNDLIFKSKYSLKPDEFDFSVEEDCAEYVALTHR